MIEQPERHPLEHRRRGLRSPAGDGGVGAIQLHQDDELRVVGGCKADEAGDGLFGIAFGGGDFGGAALSL